MDSKKVENKEALSSRTRELFARWSKKGYPHKGWYEVDILDSFELGYEDVRCEMCDTEIRNIHVLKHPERMDDVHVGCICAGHLMNDYKNPEERERKFKLKVAWGDSKLWKTNEKGNFHRKHRGSVIWACQKKPGIWRIGIKPKGYSQIVWGNKEFANAVLARRFSKEGYEKYMKKFKKAQDDWDAEALKRASLDQQRRK